jgi:hypothetical protein
MLEEALRDANKNPTEVATAMLSFVRSDLPNGGASSEERFFALFSLLCTRVFGEMQDNKSQFRHEAGGWLSSPSRWTAPRQQPLHPYGATAEHVSVNRVQSIDQDPVVQLLGPVKLPFTRPGNYENELYQRSLIDTISEEVESRRGGFYQFPFQALPMPLQHQFLMVLERSMVGIASNLPMNATLSLGVAVDPTNHQITLTRNSHRLFGSLMRVSPEGQNQVVAHQQKKLQARHQTQPLQLSPGLHSPQSMGIMSPSAAPQLKEDLPNLFLNMLEYYFFLFLRYPLSTPPRQPQTQTTSLVGAYHIPGRYRSQEIPYGEHIYMVLFNRYMRYFCPHTRVPTYTPEYSPGQARSEFFLRVVIAFWFESHGSILTTSKSIQAILDRRHMTGVQQTQKADLNMSYELTIGKFDPLPTLSQKCLRSLVLHVICDPTIRLSVTDQKPAQHWCLSQAMTTLQEPFYNYIRTTFRFASIHTQGSAFYSALNMWLIWLEPWNASYGT